MNKALRILIAAALGLHGFHMLITALAFFQKGMGFIALPLLLYGCWMGLLSFLLLRTLRQ